MINHHLNKLGTTVFCGKKSANSIILCGILSNSADHCTKIYQILHLVVMPAKKNRFYVTSHYYVVGIFTGNWKSAVDLQPILEWTYEQPFYGPLIQDNLGEPVLSQRRDLLEQPLDFCEPDVLPATQPIVSKHYRKTQWFGRQHPMSNQQCQSTEGSNPF